MQVARAFGFTNKAARLLTPTPVTFATAATTLRHSTISPLSHWYASLAEYATSSSSCTYQSPPHQLLPFRHGVVSSQTLPTAHPVPRLFVTSAVVADRASRGLDEEARYEVWRRQDLQRMVSQLTDGTERGANVDWQTRGEIERKVADLEKFRETTTLTERLNRLDGWWGLKYSTTTDFTQFLMTDRNDQVADFLEMGQIFQRYHCAGRRDGGTMENVVRWNLPAMKYPPLLTTPSTGLMTMKAEFRVLNYSALELQFKREAESSVTINEQLSAFLAPDGHLRHELGLTAQFFARWLQQCLPRDSLIRDGHWPWLSLIPPYSLRITFVGDQILVGRDALTGVLFIFEKGWVLSGEQIREVGEWGSSGRRC